MREKVSCRLNRKCGVFSRDEQNSNKDHFNCLSGQNFASTTRNFPLNLRITLLCLYQLPSKVNFSIISKGNCLDCMSKKLIYLKILTVYIRKDLFIKNRTRTVVKLLLVWFDFFQRRTKIGRRPIFVQVGL